MRDGAAPVQCLTERGGGDEGNGKLKRTQMVISSACRFRGQPVHMGNAQMSGVEAVPGGHAVGTEGTSSRLRLQSREGFPQHLVRLRRHPLRVVNEDNVQAALPSSTRLRAHCQ